MKAVNYKKVVLGMSLGTVMVLGSMSSAFAAGNDQATAAHSHAATTTTTPAEAAHSHAATATTTTTPAEAAHSHAATATTTTTPAEAAHSHAATATPTPTPAEAAHSHAATASTSAATLSAVAGSATLPTGTYYVKYTYVTDRGETAASAESSLAITLGQNLQIVVPALPSHASSINIYISSSTNTETLQVNTTSTTYDQSLPLVTGVAYPTTTTFSHPWQRR
jgi:hypothetical protein